jgi:hypothetical protein
VSGSRDPHFLDLGSSWRQVFSLTLPLYPRGKWPRYPMDRRLGGPQSRSARYGEGKILDPTGARTPVPRSSNPELIAIPTALSRLCNRTIFDLIYLVCIISELRKDYSAIQTLTPKKIFQIATVTEQIRGYQQN